MFDEVLVPYNGDDATSRALEVAAGIAQSANAELRLLAYKKTRDEEVFSDEMVKKAFDIGRRYDLTPHITALESKRFLSDAIVSESLARPTSIVCMAAHGRGRSQILTGSVSAEVMLYGTRALVLCGPECEQTFFEHGGPLIAAVDGTDESELILEDADDWAQFLGVPIEIVTVVAPGAEPELAAALASGDVTESGYLGNVVRHDSDLREHGAYYDVLHGKPAKAILAEARSRDASMIAMASKVPLGIERLRHGSVTDEVVRHSPVPVLVLSGNPFSISRRQRRKAS